MARLAAAPTHDRNLAFASVTLRRHFPLASDDALRQAAADAIETYSGRTLPVTPDRRIGGRLPRLAPGASRTQPPPTPHAEIR